MKKVYILALMLLMGQSSWAQIRDFQTTRLNSTAGAGVASVLSTEAALLNPASSTFFSGSVFSYHSYSTSLHHESEERLAKDDNFPGNNKSQGFFMSDNSGPLKGGLAYITQNENNYERTQLVAHGAGATGERTSMGFSYRYIEDTLPLNAEKRHQIHHQMSAGITHVVDESMIIGIVVIDPTRTTPEEERLFAGLHYAFASRFTLIADVGTQYTKNVMDKHIWRAAVQLQLFDDFFFRIGRFHDNIRGNKGTGWGVGWIGPRLGVEFAQKFTDQFRRDSYIYRDESLVDTSISAVIKF
jgi:hypothetical protein